jgi:hypothetical protein
MSRAMMCAAGRSLAGQASAAAAAAEAPQAEALSRSPLLQAALPGILVWPDKLRGSPGRDALWPFTCASFCADLRPVVLNLRRISGEALASLYRRQDDYIAHDLRSRAGHSLLTDACYRLRLQQDCCVDKTAGDRYQQRDVARPHRSMDAPWQHACNV